MAVAPPDGSYRAQFGEDRLLADEFGDRAGCCVEVGANDGISGSNTWYFEQRGWRCLLVEADPELADECRARRPRSTVVQCAVVAPGRSPTVRFTVVAHARGVSSLTLDRRTLAALGVELPAGSVREVEVSARTLDSVLEEAALPPIDFITIDVEGHEWDVLQGFSVDRWRPAVLIVERNRLFPRPEIMAYMRDHGYAYRRTTGVNDWFHASTTEETLSPAYRRWLFRHFYLPRYATSWRALEPEWRQAVRGVRTAVRSILASAGLLERARRARDRMIGRPPGPRA